MSYFEQSELIPLFPTPLIRGKLKDLTLCDVLEKSILKLRDEKKGAFEHGNFITTDLLHKQPEFHTLSKIVLEESNNVLDFLFVDRESHYITTMWANVTNPNHRHPVHIHPNSLLSGILYVKTPDKCGPTVFPDPRAQARVFEPNYTKMNEWNSGLFIHPPTRGTMLMWPSWMTHGVERGFSDDENSDRIVIAFNIMIRAKIDKMTAKLELK
jgi:uncharacterized protein (TIGR02466 family)